MAKSTNPQDEFSHWVDLWDKACNSDLFPKQPLNAVAETGDQLDYYDNIDRMASEEGLLREDVVEPPNPIMPGTWGKDSNPQTPWVDEASIDEIADLKKQLYEIECQLLAQEAGGKKWKEKPIMAENKALSKKILAIKEKIDRLSDKFGLGLKETR